MVRRLKPGQEPERFPALRRAANVARHPIRTLNQSKRLVRLAKRLEEIPDHYRLALASGATGVPAWIGGAAVTGWGLLAGVVGLPALYVALNNKRIGYGFPDELKPQAPPVAGSTDSWAVHLGFTNPGRTARFRVIIEEVVGATNPDSAGDIAVKWRGEDSNGWREVLAGETTRITLSRWESRGFNDDGPEIISTFTGSTGDTPVKLASEAACLHFGLARRELLCRLRIDIDGEKRPQCARYDVHVAPQSFSSPAPGVLPVTRLDEDECSRTSRQGVQ